MANRICNECEKQGSCTSPFHNEVELSGCLAFIQKVEKYTNGQMLDMLLENPKRKAIISNPYKDGCNAIIVDEHNNLVWEHDREEISFKPFYKNRLWIIIEPPKKLKEMEFGEAFAIWARSNNIKKESVKCVNGVDTFLLPWTDISKQAYQSKWTIEGVYE